MKVTIKLWEQLAQNFEAKIRAEILDIYGEYKQLPTQIQNELSFNDYLDFHLEHQNKTDTTKRKYLKLVQDLLVRVQGKYVYEEFIADQDHRIEVLEEEEQSTTIDLQPSSNHVEDVIQGTSFYVGELEVSVDK